MNYFLECKRPFYFGQFLNSKRASRDFKLGQILGFLAFFFLFTISIWTVNCNLHRCDTSFSVIAVAHGLLYSSLADFRYHNISLVITIKGLIYDRTVRVGQRTIMVSNINLRGRHYILKSGCLKSVTLSKTIVKFGVWRFFPTFLYFPFFCGSRG